MTTEVPKNHPDQPDERLNDTSWKAAWTAKMQELASTLNERHGTLPEELLIDISTQAVTFLDLSDTDQIKQYRRGLRGLYIYGEGLHSGLEVKPGISGFLAGTDTITDVIAGRDLPTPAEGLVAVTMDALHDLHSGGKLAPGTKDKFVLLTRDAFKNRTAKTHATLSTSALGLEYQFRSTDHAGTGFLHAVNLFNAQAAKRLPQK